MHTVRRGLAALMILALPACTITLREPTLRPLNTNRFYAADLGATCDAVDQALQKSGLAIKDSQREDRACLVDTNFKVLSDTGEDPANHLKKVAWTGVGGFIGGRYTVTVTTRTVRDGGTRVRVSTRVEGYINEEFGYQVLRSRGIIEDTLFSSIAEQLGTAAVEAG